MNMCSDGHEEVVYECRDCPVCDMKTEKEKEIDELKERNSVLNENLNELENRFSELENEIRTLNNLEKS